MKTWNCEISVFIFFRYILRSRIAASHGGPIFYCLRNLHIVFHSCCARLHSYQHCTRVPLFPYPQQHCLCFVFLTAAIQGIRLYLSVIGFASPWWLVILSIFYMFVGPTVSFFKKLFIKSNHFLIGLSFGHWVVWVLCIFCILTPYQT